MTSFSTTHFLFAILVFLLVLLTAATAAFVPGKSLLKSHRWLAAGSLLAFAVLVLATNVLSLRAATGYLPYPLSARHDPDRLDLRASHALHLARTPLLQLVRLEHMDLGFLAEEAPSKGPWSDVPGALGAAVRAARILPGEGDRQLPNLVLVVVESWGLAQDAPLRDALVQPYLEPNLLARYQVLQGAVPFYGSTIPGEARELCGTSIGFHLVNASASDLQACFPNQLAALGYHRIAVHGMSGNLFNRIAWYRTIGFQEVLFRSDFDRQGLRDCTGFFTGNCDADIAAWIGRRLESDSSHPLFIHWMTLNSHLPVPVPSPLANGAPCSAALSLEPNSALCSWYQLVANVHRSVAQVAMETLARPTVFVIVGDHAPPFGDSAWRSRFSRSDVPYIILLPRTDRSDSKPMSTSSAPAAARHSSQ